MAEKVVELVYAENGLPASGTCPKFILVTDQGRLLTPEAALLTGLMRVVELASLAGKMENLVDAHSSIFHWSLREDGADVESYLSALLASFACPVERRWVLEEAAEFVRAAEITTLMVLLSEAHLLDVAFLQRLLALTGRLFADQVCWLVDDLAVLTRFALPKQMAFCVEGVRSRPTDEIVIEVMGELLDCGLLPSLDLCTAMMTAMREDGPGAVRQLRRLLRVALLEHSMRVWDSEAYKAAPSFQREIARLGGAVDPGDLQQHGDRLVADAKAWVRRWATAWHILAILRGTYSDCFPISPVDLLKSLPALGAYLNGWLKGLMGCAAFLRLDGEARARRAKILSVELQRQASLSACPFMKDLIQRLPRSPSPAGRAELSTVQEWVESALLTVTLDAVPLHEALVVALGPASQKLLNPRILETLQLALERPQFYGGPRPADLDCSVVYRLASECGRFINAHDWYISFRQSVDPGRGQRDEAALIVRFMRAVSELQLFGLVAPTKKRRDHYERLVVFHR